MSSISIGRARLAGPWHSACQALHADSGKRNLFIEVYRRFRVRVPALDEPFACSIARSLDRQPRNRGLLISFRFTIDGRHFTIYRTLIPPLSIASRFYALLLLCLPSRRSFLSRSFDRRFDSGKLGRGRLVWCFSKDVEWTVDVCTFVGYFTFTDFLAIFYRNHV